VRFVRETLRWVTIAALASASLAGLVFGLTVTPLTFGLLVFSAAPIRQRTWRFARAAVLLLVAVAAAFAWHVPFHEYADRIQSLSRSVEAGPKRLSTRDLAAIWTLNLVMAAGGWLAGFPEAAGETAGLVFRGPDERVHRSDMAMRSPTVRRAVARGFAAAAASGSEDLGLPAQRIVFMYDPDRESLRAALALNPLLLAGRVVRAGQGWRADLQATVQVAYPRRAVLRLRDVRGRSLVIDEGLFWALQQRGWLHPYVATWQWSVWSNDPRLADLERPIRVAWERLVGSILFRHDRQGAGRGRDPKVDRRGEKQGEQDQEHGQSTPR
jgi:hypothetical protein